MSKSVAAANNVVFGRYTLVRPIARGGMAEIFLAKQQGPGRFERSLVIKRILPHLVAEGSQFTQMFLDEAALAAQLSHPHIAQVYDFGHEEGSYFLALELVKGPDLRNLIRTAQKLGLPPPPIEVSVKIMANVLGALDHAHHAKSDAGQPLNIVHRDVSPQNVLVSYDGVVKLVDFGIAKAATGSTETEAGVVKGKYAYFAPEQVRRLPLDGRVDLFAATLVLYELLTLQQANPGEGMEAVMAAAEGRFTPIDKVRPDLPDELVKVVKRGMHLQRDKRQADCREMQQDLEGLLVGWGLSMGPHEIAAYIRELEEKNGSPLSTAVAQPAAEDAPPAGEVAAAPSPKIDTRPGHTPPPARLRTGPRPALDVPPSESAERAPRPERPPPKAAEPEPSAADDLGGPTFNGAETPPTERPHPVPEPARPAVRQRTGTRQALDPSALGASSARPPTGLRRTGTRPALDPAALGSASARPPSAAAQRARPSAPLADDDDEGESTELGLDPPPRMRSNARAKAVNISADATLPPRTPAFRDAEPTPTPAILPPPRRAKKAKSGSGLGTFVIFIVLLVGGVAAVGYGMGVRPADFRDVHTLGALKQVLVAKLSDKPAPKPAEGPLAKPPPPPAPPPALLPAAAAPEPAPAPTTPTSAAASSANAPQARPPAAAKPTHSTEGEAHRHPSKPASKPAAKPAATPAAEPPAVAAEPAPPAIGSVTFTIKPWANVTVNGKQLGASPLPTEEMAVGSYTAEFSNPAVDHVVKRNFTVTPGAHLEIVVDMEKK